MLRRLRGARTGQRGGRLLAPICLLATGLGVAAVVLLPAPALAVRVSPRRPASTGMPWLLVQHGRISNQLGQTVILRGFNDDALLQTGSEPLPPALTAADAALMESEGFDAVRLPISWSLLEPRPGQMSWSYRRRIEQTVALLARHRLYTILDMHTEDFGVGFGGSGAPSWLSVPGVPDIHLPGLTEAWQRHLSPAVNAALAFFWIYPNWQRLYWQAWSFVAGPLRNDSAVAGYDLYNEPHPFPIPPGIFATRLLWPFYASGIKAISKVDPNHLFIVEGDLFGDNPTAIRPLHAADLVYSTHLYAGSILPPAFDGSVGPLRSELDQALAEAAQLPAPYWSGEIGIDHTLPMADSWARAEISLSNQHLTGWAWWEWDDPDGWGVRQGQGPPDMGWLSVLAQPFVRAAPGRLQSMSFDLETGVFRAQISDAPPGSALLVSWPRTAGPVRLLSSCAALGSPTQPSSGELVLRVRSGSCSVRLQGLAG